MLVPKAAMDENGMLVFRKNDIRFSGQVISIKPEPISLVMQERANSFFGFGVLVSNTCHHFTAFGFGHNVGHRSYLQSECKSDTRVFNRLDAAKSPVMCHRAGPAEDVDNGPRLDALAIEQLVGHEVHG